MSEEINEITNFMQQTTSNDIFIGMIIGLAIGIIGLIVNEYMRSKRKDSENETIMESMGGFSKNNKDVKWTIEDAKEYCYKSRSMLINEIINEKEANIRMNKELLDRSLSLVNATIEIERLKNDNKRLNERNRCAECLLRNEFNYNGGITPEEKENDVRVKCDCNITDDMNKIVKNRKTKEIGKEYDPEPYCFHGELKG